ncbi:MAG: SBBP repeat-containing protein [Oligoflexia bacterium]|nr:SBBP repeat-containing protein [Oligoflexia bacterium]
MGTLFRQAYLNLIVACLCVPAIAFGDTEATRLLPQSLLAATANFVRNEGQFGHDSVVQKVKFGARAPGLNLWADEAGFFVDFLRRTSDSQLGFRVRLSPAHPSPNMQLMAEERNSGTVSSFVGPDPQSWVEAAPSYRTLRYSEIYEGTDLVLRLNNGNPRYDFELKPYASILGARLRIEGISRAKIDSNGNLLLENGADVWRNAAPVTFEIDANGNKIERQSGFQLGGIEGQSITVGFWVKERNPNNRLVIDPTIYSTFIGGSGVDDINSVVTDSAGNIYVAGTTTSAANTFSLALNGYQVVRNSAVDSFIAKFAYPAGASAPTPVWMTFLGSTGADFTGGITVDSAGAVYFAGKMGGGAPLVNPIKATQAFGDAYVAKLSANGSSLLYGTYLGGAYTDAATDIAVDSTGKIYVVGTTQSFDFPTTAGAVSTQLNAHANPAPSSSDDYDAFLVRLNPSASGNAQLMYSTLWGGVGDDSLSTLAIAPALTTTVYVGGVTAGAAQTTPGAYRNIGAGAADGLVGRFQFGTAVAFTGTLLGGAGNDQIQDLALDSIGNPIVVGQTLSLDYPATAGAFDPVCGADGFVTRLDPSLSSVGFSSCIGGSGTDDVEGIAIDNSGNYILGGFTNSTDLSHPFAESPAYMGGSAPGDGFLAKVSSSGQLLYSSYFGGSGADDLHAIAVHPLSQRVVVVGRTNSANYPVVGNSLTSRGLDDGVISVVDLSGYTSPSYSLRALVLGAANQPIANQMVSISPGGYVASTSANGEISLSLPAGTYSVSVPDIVGNSAYTFSPAAASVTLNAQNPYPSQLIFSAIPVSRVSGYVSVPQSGGLSGVSINVSPGNYSAVTDSAGFWQVYLPAGTYTANPVSPQGAQGNLYAFLTAAANPFSVDGTSSFGLSYTAYAIPLAPSNVVVTQSSSSSATISWNDNSNNETSFIVERSVNGAAFTVIATKASDVTSHLNSGLSVGSSYQYRVGARNGSIAVSPYALSPTFTLLTASTATPTPTSTATSTATAMATSTPTATATATATLTPTVTATYTNTATATPTLTPTATKTATPTVTTNNTPTASPSATITSIATATATATRTSTATSTPTATGTALPTAASTWTPTPTATVMASATATATVSVTPVSTPSFALLSPRLDCIELDGAGAFTAHFGYLNGNSLPLNVAIGANNWFTPNPVDRGQSTNFGVGLIVDAFTVSSSGGVITWWLAGKAVTADAHSALCDGLINCVGPQGQSGQIDQCGVCGGDNACIDCAGATNGNATFDRCGVCGGDGASCLGCIRQDLSATISALVTSLTQQIRVYRQLVKLVKKHSKNSVVSKYVRQRGKLEQSFIETLALIEEMPLDHQNCANRQYCQNLDRRNQLKSVSSLVTKVKAASDGISRGLGRGVVASKRIRTTPSYQASIKLLMKVPRYYSLCE